MDTLGESEFIKVINLGRIGYADALALQRETHEQLIAGRVHTLRNPAPMTVFLLEHDPPVITVTRRVHAAAHVLASDDVLAQHGIARIETDRGGDVTYHGPGQLVAYPILDLARLQLKVHPYVRWLEKCIIDTLALSNLEGVRDPSATGVWVGEAQQPQRKIAAIGVRLSRFASLHGFALNVAPNLAHFDLIVPCGLARPVTSVHAELERARVGESTHAVRKIPRVEPSMNAVKHAVTHWFIDEVARLMRAVSSTQA